MPADTQPGQCALQLHGPCRPEAPDICPDARLPPPQLSCRPCRSRVRRMPLCTPVVLSQPHRRPCPRTFGVIACGVVIRRHWTREIVVPGFSAEMTCKKRTRLIPNPAPTRRDATPRHCLGFFFQWCEISVLVSSVLVSSGVRRVLRQKVFRFALDRQSPPPLMTPCRLVPSLGCTVVPGMWRAACHALARGGVSAV